MQTKWTLYFSIILLVATVLPLSAQEVQPSPYPQAYTQPPPPPVRLSAEWEEVQALLVSWRDQHSVLLREIVRHGSQAAKVIIFASNPSAVSSYLTAGGVSLSNVEILSPDYDSIWIRDYGPWTIYQSDVDSLMIADWIYNRPWRPNDNNIPVFIAEHLGLPVYRATETPYDWVHTGGNNLGDGMGTIFSSDLVLEENFGKTEAQIDEIAKLYLGADRYVKFPSLPYDAIHHLDMHMRFIDEETVIVGAYPEGVADGPQIEENLAYLRHEVPTAFGNEYRIIRIPMPPDGSGRYPDNNGHYRTYTNSLFVNGTVLVPIYEERYDTTALRIYQEALPGYNIVGIDCNGIIPSFGAIHCITKLVGVHNPLWIAHARLRDQEQSETPYPVEAIIKHRTGISTASLHYRRAGESSYTALPMTLADSAAATWTASIPPQAENTVVEYYIAAQASDGKTQQRPMVAPEGYFRFKVDALQPAFAPAQAELCPGQSLAFENLTIGTYDSLRWHFPGGQPATATVENPAVVYPQSGRYDLRLVVYKGNLTDTLLHEQAVIVRHLSQPYVETFAGTAPPADWEVDNPDDDAAFWEWSNETLCEPGFMAVNNFSVDTRGTRDYLRAHFDLSSLDEPMLYFKLAYAQRNSTLAERLRVHLIDCDGQRLTVFDKAGSELATAPPQLTPFQPESCEQWRLEMVDLSAFAGEAVTVEFEQLGGYGNFLYLGEVEVGNDRSSFLPIRAKTALAATLFPNPARGQVMLSLDSPAAGHLEWTLLNALGQAARSGSTSVGQGPQEAQLPLQALVPGHYRLQLVLRTEQTTARETTLSLVVE